LSLLSFAVFVTLRFYAMGFGDTSKKDKQKAGASADREAGRTAAEDASWQDDSKGTKKKAERAAAKEEKADAKIAARKERDELEAAESAASSTMKGASKGSSKMTQAEIQRRQALMAMAAAKAAPKKSAKTQVVAAPKVEENINRADSVEVSGIDAALGALETPAETKSSKMTYKEFEAMMLPQIQEENPGLKMSQAKDRASKLWDRAPENPRNQEK